MIKMLILCMFIFSTSLFASKARMSALGQDTTQGSYYLEDTRNIFHNPALINRMNNYFITEWGESSDNGDTEISPQAEGGIFAKGGNFVYGIYLGNETLSQNQSRSSAFMQQDNRTDLFFAGDAGIEWGGRISVANGKDESGAFDKTNQAVSLGLGALRGPYSFYADFILKDKSEGGTVAADAWDGSLGMTAGGAFKTGDITIFAQYESKGYKETLAAVSTDQTYQNIVVGAGLKDERDNGARILANISYQLLSDKLTGGTESKTNYQALPLVLGFERQVKDWLTLRSSIKQNILIGSNEVDNKVKTVANSTIVSAGATLIVDKVEFDGVIGTTEYSRIGDNGKNGVLALDNLMTRVSLVYKF